MLPLALITLVTLISTVLAVPGRVYCDPAPTSNWRLATVSCDAAVTQMPSTVRSVDFTVTRDGHAVPANAFTSGNPANPHNLPQSFISRGCEIEVSLQADTPVFLSTWYTVKRAADRVIDACVTGGDGGGPGRGGNYTLDVLVVRVLAFDRYYPRYPNN